MKILVDVDIAQISSTDLAAVLARRGWHVFETWPVEVNLDVALDVLINRGVPPELLRPVERWLNDELSLAELQLIIAALG